MTDVQISKIQQARHIYCTLLPRRHKKELDEARKLLIRLESKCDHKHSNGKSALVGGILAKRCELCFKELV